MNNINEFPSYIGFGRLKPDNTIENAEEVKAEYFFQDKPVHRVTYSKVRGTWVIEDIFNDKKNITSWDKLSMAVQMHFRNLNCETNDIFHYVRNKVCSLDNICFQNLASKDDKGGVASYFPAGRLVILRLPIFMANSGLTRTDILETQIPISEEGKAPLIKLCEAYCTSIIQPLSDLKVIPVLMVEYIVTLASVFDVVDWMSSNNLIGKEKIFRMIIQDAITKNTSKIQTFEGIDKDDTFYSILLKGFGTSITDFEEFEKKIVEGYVKIPYPGKNRPPIYLS